MRIKFGPNVSAFPPVRWMTYLSRKDGNVRRRIILQEKKRTYTNNPETTQPNEEWVEESVLESDSARATGGYLRALADEIDPPKDGSYAR